MQIRKAVAKFTGTREEDWELIDGPDSRCGVDYWLENKETQQAVYVNEDQGHITIELLNGD